MFSFSKLLSLSVESSTLSAAVAMIPSRSLNTPHIESLLIHKNLLIGLIGAIAAKQIMPLYVNVSFIVPVWITRPIPFVIETPFLDQIDGGVLFYLQHIHFVVLHIYTQTWFIFVHHVEKNGDGELVLMFLNKKGKKLKLLVHRMFKSENFMV